ncbi:MAG: GTPase [Gemmatimonadota bacterium]
MTKQSASTPARPTGPPARWPADFIGSFPDPLHLLDPPLPEIAFLGRSNVGKSSLLNALVGIKGLAKVSGTPGKTQTMNVFRVVSHGSWVVSARAAADPRPTTHDPRPFYLIDLPGYGYANTSKTERARFAALIQRFLTERPSVTSLVWLLDIRRDPSAEDRTMAELLGERGLPVLAVLTKADKLGIQVRRTQTKSIAQALGLTEDQVEVTSSKSGDGMAELRDTVEAAVGGREE